MEEKCRSIEEGDYVLIDPHHTFGKVVVVYSCGNVEVYYTNRLGMPKTITLPASRLHKVIFVEDLTH